MNDNIVTIKRGDAILFTATYRNAEGQPVDLTPYVITSQARDGNDALVVQFTVTKADQTTSPGVYSLSAPLDTLLPVGTLLWDIQYSNAGVKESTATIQMVVLPEITRP